MTNENYSEKVSVNINTSTLSNIDILVDHGYYSNRSDFINQALREGLQKHQATLDRIIDRNINTNHNFWFVGVGGITKDDVEEAKKNRQVMTCTGYGVLHIAKDIDEELLFEVFKSIQVKGRVHCTPTVKAHYGLK